VRAGERARGRDLLLRVVAADDQMEPAWLWLSAALDDPADQLAALENVLLLNPSNAQARAGAERLQRQIKKWDTPTEAVTKTGEASQPVSVEQEAPSPASGESGSRTDLYVADEDPFQCAFCGQQTVEADERCPHCRRSLLIPGFWRGGGYQYSLLILVGLQVQAAMVQTAAAYIAAFLPQSLAALPGSELVAASPLIVAAARLVLWAIVLMMLLGDSLAAYPWSAVLSTVDLTWQTAGWWFGMVGQELAGLNGLMSLLIAIGGLAAAVGQRQARRRIRVIPDRGIQSGPLFHQRAEHYARRQMWAMAAIHWQKAIGRQPRVSGYYKSLGQAQAKMGRYVQAVKTFRSGAELAPEDPEFSRLIQAVRTTARMS